MQLHDSDDDILTRRGRRLHPTCAFWWGRRIEGSRTAAVCYVCGVTMTTFPSVWPLNAGARTTILRHRGKHLAELVPSILAVGDKA
jgi:hypothetical protein